LDITVDTVYHVDIAREQVHPSESLRADVDGRRLPTTRSWSWEAHNRCGDQTVTARIKKVRQEIEPATGARFYFGTQRWNSSLVRYQAFSQIANALASCHFLFSQSTEASFISIAL